MTNERVFANHLFVTKIFIYLFSSCLFKVYMPGIVLTAGNKVNVRNRNISLKLINALQNSKAVIMILLEIEIT